MGALRKLKTFLKPLATFGRRVHNIRMLKEGTKTMKTTTQTADIDITLTKIVKDPVAICNTGRAIKWFEAQKVRPVDGTVHTPSYGERAGKFASFSHASIRRYAEADGLTVEAE